MQFIVFAAFAIVLSLPEGGPPWKTFGRGAVAWLLVVVATLLPPVVAALYARRVRNALEHEPAWLPAAQRQLARGNAAIRAALVFGLILALYLTDWSVMVRSWRWTGIIYGLDEFVMLAPFLLGLLAAWTTLYPADRGVRQVAMELQLWVAGPVHPVWGLRAYLSFMFRHHVLIILLPMVPIMMAHDFTLRHADRIRAFFGLAWADQLVLVVLAGIVFTFAPVMLRYVWHTRPLPAGPLRDRLDRLCRQIGLTYRQILIWQSDGMVVNAAVMGLWRPVRYILLSDGLLEMMEDRKIEAVFGHEAGHIKNRHIWFYLLFAVLSMLIVGGLAELAFRLRPDLFTAGSLVQDYMQVILMALVVALWVVGFGWISRRFEWQADLFGARSVTPPPELCDHLCLFHETASLLSPDPPPEGQPLCATAASLFADALERIAALNGIAVDARSWRHSSIAYRIERLRAYASDPRRAPALERSVWAIQVVLQVGVAVGLAIAVWLYWPA